MTGTIRLLIIDDTCLYREGLAAILGREEWVATAHTTADADGAFHELAVFRPDVVLLNMATVGSAAILDTVVRTAPAVRVVALGGRRLGVGAFRLR